MNFRDCRRCRSVNCFGNRRFRCDLCYSAAAAVSGLCQLPDLAAFIARARKSAAETAKCTRSIRCSDRATATRSASRWRGSAFPTTSSRSTSCKGESRTPEFLAKNPSGHVPLLEVAPGRYLAESNAILWYIAGGTPLAPDDRIDRAEALQWMFFEQHSLEPNIGAAYFWLALVKGGRELQMPRARGLDGEGLRRVRRDGEAPRRATTSSSPTTTPSPTSRSTPTPTSRTNATSTSRAIPGDPRLARPRRRRARPRRHGLAAGAAGGGAITRR